MLTVAELLKELEKYPAGALVYAYEGEATGIVIISSADERRELGFIEARDPP